MKGGRHNPVNTKKDIRREERLTRPPRMKSAVHHRAVKSRKKRKGSKASKKK